MRIYFGFAGWGWRMYGIGYKTKWFLGFSMNISAATKQAEGANQGAEGEKNAN